MVCFGSCVPTKCSRYAPVPQKNQINGVLYAYNKNGY
jgi:hypothetical protein